MGNFFVWEFGNWRLECGVHNADEQSTKSWSLNVYILDKIFDVDEVELITCFPNEYFQNAPSFHPSPFHGFLSISNFVYISL